MKKYLIISLVFLFFIPLNSTPVVVSGGSYNDIRGRMCRYYEPHSLISVIVRAPNWNDGDLYFSRTIDNGLGWPTPTPILVESGDQTTPCILQTSDDTIRVFYASNETGDYKICEFVSLDSGIVWEKRGRIDLGWTSSSTVYDPIVIEEDDGSLTMIYCSRTGGTGSAYVSNRPNGGSFDTLKTLVNSTSTYRPGIIKHPDGTYMAAYHRKTGSYYYENDVFIRTSTDRVNWSSEVQLTTNMNSHDAFVNITSDSAYLVYYAKNAGGHYNLARRRSYDGVTFEGEEQITNYPTNQTKPCFFVEGNFIYQMWTYAVDYDTNNDIYFEKLDYTPSYIEEIPNITNNNIRVFTKNKKITVNFLSSNNINSNISIYNLVGQKILTQVNNRNIVVFDLSNYPTGQYLIKIKTENLEKIFKVLLI